MVEKAQVVVKCPNPRCPASYRVNETLLGRKGKCKKCQTTFVLTRTEGQKPTTASASTGTETGDKRARPRGDGGVPESWEPGDIILDQYEVRPFSDTLPFVEGGMGRVNRVWHRGWNTELAVKSVKPEYLNKKQSAIDNFLAEAEVWVEKLGMHPHVVSCYYVRILGGSPRVFVEYVDGGSLKDWITSGKLHEGGPDVALPRILDIAIQFAWGLEYTHEVGLVHQDVKPANVMMTGTGTAKVTDFGIARAREAAGDTMESARPDQSLYVPGAGFFTRAYASPEQFEKKANKVLTRRTDMWSWAVSVMEMFIPTLVTGSFLGPAAPLALKRYLQDQEPEAGNLAIPKEVADLLEQCLANDPDERPKSMQAIAARLQEIYQQAAGRPYPRAQARRALSRADELNNQALSLLDLGKVEQAEKRWEQALAADPNHFESHFNLGLRQWRTGRCTDRELVNRLETVRRTRPGEDTARLMAEVHRERGDLAAAATVLGEPVDSQTGRRRFSEWKHPIRKKDKVDQSVRTAALSPDGRYAVTARLYDSIELWETASGQRLGIVEGLKFFDSRQAFCLSSDGRSAVICANTENFDNDYRAELWDLRESRCLQTYRDAPATVTGVCLTPDERCVVGACKNGTVPVWDKTSGQVLHSLTPPPGAPAASPMTNFKPLVRTDGRRVWAVLGRHVICWNLEDGERTCVEMETSDNRGGIWDLSADGRCAVGGSRESFRIWEASTGRLLHAFESKGHWYSPRVSADGRYLVACQVPPLGGSAATTEWPLCVWELPSMQMVYSFSHPKGGPPRDLTSSGRLLTCESTGYAEVWDLELTRPGHRAVLVLSRTSSVEEALADEQACESGLEAARTALERGDTTATLDHLRTLRARPRLARREDVLSSWKELYTRLPHPRLSAAWEVHQTKTSAGGLFTGGISPDGRLAVFADKKVTLYDMAENRQIAELEAESKGWAGSAAFSPDGRLARVGTDIYEVGTGRRLTSLPAGKQSECVIFSTAFSPDGSQLVRAEADDHSGKNPRLTLWETATSQQLASLEGERVMDLRQVCFAPDPRYLVVGFRKGRLELWRMADAARVRGFSGLTSGPEDLTFSPDGRYLLATGSNDENPSTLRGCACLWDVRTGRCVQTFLGHNTKVNTGRVSVDNRHVLTGSGFSDAGESVGQLWEVATGRCVRVFEGHKGGVRNVALTPDGRHAFTLDDSGTLKTWFLDWELEPRTPSDWDEGARPLLAAFLIARTPRATGRQPRRASAWESVVAGLERRGKPKYSENDFQHLLSTLGAAGYGWLRPEGVRRQLDRMASTWEGSPSLE